MFNPRKSYRHPALREPAAASVVYDDWPVLGCKITKKIVTRRYGAKKSAKKDGDLTVFSKKVLLHRLSRRIKEKKVYVLEIRNEKKNEFFFCISLVFS